MAPHPNAEPVLDDGTREIKILGCEYRVPEQDLIDVINYYGQLQSDIVEELFEDGGTGNPDTDGTNRTGTYIARVTEARWHIGMSSASDREDPGSNPGKGENY